MDRYFPNGAEVEISSNDQGFRGAWYSGTVIGRTRFKTKLLIEYKTLTADNNGTRPLRETLELVQLRPPPPREPYRLFKFSEEVDAYHSDGWWEGVITGVHSNDRYSVYFRGTKDQIEFGHAELRLHREWINGKWVPPLEDEVSIAKEANSSKEKVEDKFSKGASVEVSSDEEGFQGAWFGATVIEQLSDDKFLIEYQNLRNDDDTEFMREEVDSLHIRPCPPEDLVVDRFSQLEEVDALYNDGWWIGVISKVLNRQRYIVYFKGTSEEMEFKHSELRLHQDWMDGKWLMASKALKL